MEEARAIHQRVSSEPGNPSSPDDAIFLEQFIGEQAVSLMGILRSYVLHYQLARGKEEAQEAALELLHEVYIKATKSYARFDRSRPIRAWLLTIARNLARDKQAVLGKRQQHEVLMCDIRQQAQDSQRDEDPLERLFAGSDSGPEQQIEIRDLLTSLLSRLSEDHQHVLRLWVVEGLDGTELAEQLSCSYENAIVRLHRARKQLRTMLATERREG